MKRDKPNKIVASLQSEINAAIELLLPPNYLDTWNLPKGYIVDSCKGRAYQSEGAISVPLAAYRKGADYFLYYTAHELSHIFSISIYHDFAFYQHFMKICPIEYQYFELSYKPSSARYGIKKP